MKTRVSNAAKKAIFMASLAVASVLTTAAAHAQYMVIDGVSAPETRQRQVTCQSLYVQDYSSFQGVGGTVNETQEGMSSLQIINGLFDGYVGVFGTLIGIPAIIVAALRLFVREQTDRKPKKKSFALPAAPAPSRIYRPSLAAKY
jgi:hypothetical protein